MNNMITIFTPTYNRAKTLIRVYNSLKVQTCKKFEWLIIDDGSVDNTKELVDTWIKESIINIRYIYQENHGKTYSLNQGVKAAKYEWFFCLDSDDYLAIDAIEILNFNLEKIKNSELIGIIALKRNIYAKEEKIKKISTGTILSFAELYRKYKFNGETVMIYKTKDLKNNLFPIIDGEKFIPEQYLYDRMDNIGNLYFISNCIYFYEYQPDGYTKNMNQILKANPRGYLIAGNQRFKYSKLFRNKIRGAIQVNIANMLLNNKLRDIRKDYNSFIYSCFICI